MDIKTLRKCTGLTQREFANKYEIPLKTLQHWECGDSRPASYLLKLLEKDILDCNEIITISTKSHIFYYNKSKKNICDEKGTYLNIEIKNINLINMNNLGIDLEFLFEEYYAIKDKFISRCEDEINNDIMWERFL